MAARKAKTPPKKTTKTPPRKPIGRIQLQDRSRGGPDGDSDDGLLELGPELVSGDDFDPTDDDLNDMGSPPDSELPPLAARPTRRANKHTIFPDPGSFKLTWDAGRQYWKKLWDDPRTRPRLRVYIYRWFPAMIDEKSPKTGVSYRHVVRMDGDVPDSQPDKQAKPLTISEILHRYGTGDYGFKINDSGAGNQQICQFSLTERSDMRDWENYPPILDIDGVDLADPMNATYIKQMKSRKNWDSDEEKDENMQALERMADRMVKLAEKQSERRPQESDKSAEVVAHAATLGQDLLAKSVERLIGMQGNSGGNAVDTMTMVTALVELVKGMKGENQLEIISQVMARSAEAERAAYNAQISGLQTNLNMLMARMDEKRSNPGGDSDEYDPLSKLKLLAESKEILAGLFEGGARRAAAAQPWYVEHAPILLQFAGPLVQSLQYLFQSMATRGTGQPVPPPPPPIDPRAIQAGMGQTGPAGPQAGPTGPGPGPAGQTGPQPAQQHPQASDVVAFLEQLRQPLLRYLNEGRSGFEFADLFIEWFGQDAYDQVSQNTPMQLLQLLSTYPPIWGDIAPRQQQAAKFLDEFVSEPPPDSSDDQTPEQEPVKPNGMDAAGGTTTTAAGTGPALMDGPKNIRKKAGKPVEV